MPFPNLKNAGHLQYWQDRMCDVIFTPTNPKVTQTLSREERGDNLDQPLMRENSNFGWAQGLVSCEVKQGGEEILFLYDIYLPERSVEKRSCCWPQSSKKILYQTLIALL